MGTVRQADKKQYKHKKKNETRLSSYLKKKKDELGKHIQ